MKRSWIGLLVVGSLALNTVLMFWLAGAEEAEASFPAYNGGKILVISNRSGDNEIYIMNADGTNAVNLTNNPASEGGARWSPDGTKITFHSNREGNNEIYVMDVDGSNVARLTNNPASDVNPYWSPDGSKIGFESNREVGTRQWYMNSDGSNPTCITCGFSAGAFNADWSPLGDKIAIQVNGVGNGIFTVDINGDNLTQLTTLDVGYGAHQSPHWSPDGTKIVFTGTRAPGDGTMNEIEIINSDGTGRSKLTDDNLYDSGAKISPDGTLIAYTHAPNPASPGVRDIWVMNMDGSEKRRLIQTGFTEWHSGWQPILNASPNLATKTLSVLSGASQLIDVLAGAIDEEPLSPSNLTITTHPTHGAAILEAGKIKYTASSSYVGADSLEYQVCDSFMLDQKCSSQVVHITINPKLSVSKIGNVAVDGGSKVISSTNKPTFSGQTTPLSQVRVEIHSDPIILTTTADSHGYWSITPEQPLPSGEHTVYISATLNGQTIQLDSFVLGIQPTTPNTGADYSMLRWAGLGLLAIGVMGWYIPFRSRKIGVSELFSKLILIKWCRQ